MPERAGGTPTTVESTDPRHLGFGDAGLHTHRLDQVVDRTGRDNTARRPPSPPRTRPDRSGRGAARRIAGKKEPLRSLDSQFHVTGLRTAPAIGHRCDRSPECRRVHNGQRRSVQWLQLAEFLQHQTDGIIDQSTPSPVRNASSNRTGQTVARPSAGFSVRAWRYTPTIRRWPPTSSVHSATTPKNPPRRGTPPAAWQCVRYR